MPENILEKIIKKKIEKVDILKKSIDLKSLDELINKNKIGHKTLFEDSRQTVINIDKKALNHIACTDIGDNILPNSQ